MSRGKGGKVLGLSAFPRPPADCLVAVIGKQSSSIRWGQGRRGVGVRHEGKPGVILNWGSQRGSRVGAWRSGAGGSC